MKTWIIFFAFVFSFAQANAQTNPADPEVVQEVDTQRYVGLWYEIGHLPNFFQKGVRTWPTEHANRPRRPRLRA